MNNPFDILVGFSGNGFWQSLVGSPEEGDAKKKQRSDTDKGFVDARENWKDTFIDAIQSLLASKTLPSN